jgi:phenylacetate-CoA ligase
MIGKQYRKTYQFLEESQWWSKEQQIDYHYKALKDLLQLSYDRSLFYRKQFDSVGFHPGDFRDVVDIRQLPLIDKHTINENVDNILTVAKSAGHVDYTTTGGTSGTPLRFYTTSKRSEIELAYLNSGWSRAGYHLGDTMAVVRGRVFSSSAEQNIIEEDKLLRSFYYNSFKLNDENIRRYLDHIKKIGKCYLHVYPSTGAAISRFINRAKYDPPTNIQGILAESEIVYEDQRELIEGALGCRLFSSYGHTEKLVAAAACEHTYDYHVWPTYGYFELLDENGREVTEPGKVGEIVGTGYINDVMPFIRYKTGDMAEYVGEKCEHCGREHKIIRNIRGHRVQEELVAKDNAKIPWTALNMHDDTFDEVMRFQFVQDKPGIAQLNIVPSERYNEESKKKILNNLSKKFSDTLEVNLIEVESIKLTDSGKSIYVVQNIK